MKRNTSYAELAAQGLYTSNTGLDSYYKSRKDSSPSSYIPAPTAPARSPSWNMLQTLSTLRRSVA